MNERRNHSSEGSKSGLPISEATLQRMLALQEQRLALEVKQADIALRELDHNQKIADKSIDTQAEDRKDERRMRGRMHTQTLFFAGVVTALALAFVLVALWMGKEAIVLDVLKVVMGFVGGWGASNIWQRRNSAKGDDA